MITPELVSYIKGQVEAGISRDTITSALISQGWSEADITEAFTPSQAIPVPPQNQPVSRRRKLLPWWIRFFTWVFMIMGALSPIVFIAGILVTGINFDATLFGLDTHNPLSATGIFIFLLFAFYGIIAFALWNEKKWAIKLAKIGALLGIGLCIFMMFVYPFILNHDHHISIRLELLVLIPYFFRLRKIQSKWEAM